MPQEGKSPPIEIAGLFTASENLYRAMLAETAAGRPLPDGAESASHIAFSVAMTALREHVPCPDWAADRVSSDWAQFEDFKCRTIGDAFGIPDHKHMHAKRKALLGAYAYNRVREYRDKGLPLKDGAKGKGALFTVGDELHMSGKQVEKLVTDWRKLCRDSGRDPDERPAYADPRPVIYAAIARALRPDK